MVLLHSRIHASACNGNSRKFFKKGSYLAHLRDTSPSCREYGLVITRPTDRRVRVQDRFLPSF